MGPTSYCSRITARSMRAGRSTLRVWPSRRRLAVSEAGQPWLQVRLRSTSFTPATRGGIQMTKVDEISNVGILVKNQKRSIDFYTKKLSLKKLTSMPEFGYVELRAKKNGKDAVLNLWEPKAMGISAKEAKKKIGQITGVGFSTPNLDATVAQLKKKGVKVDVWNEGDDYRMATVYDPD